VEPVQPRLLPAADRVRPVHHLQPGPVRAQEGAHRRLQLVVHHQDHGVAEGLAGERETEAERAAGRLHDHRAGSKLSAFASGPQHGNGATRFHATGAQALELGPEPAVPVRQWCVDAGDRTATEEVEQVPVLARDRHDGRSV
jgi:hypothetical protein